MQILIYDSVYSIFPPLSLSHLLPLLSFAFNFQLHFKGLLNKFIYNIYAQQVLIVLLELLCSSSRKNMFNKFNFKFIISFDFAS